MQILIRPLILFALLLTGSSVYAQASAPSLELVVLDSLDLRATSAIARGGPVRGGYLSRDFTARSPHQVAA